MIKFPDWFQPGKTIKVRERVFTLLLHSISKYPSENRHTNQTIDPPETLKIVALDTVFPSSLRIYPPWLVLFEDQKGRYLQKEGGEDPSLSFEPVFLLKPSTVCSPPSCARPLDPTEKSCWWCGTSVSTAGVTP